MSFNLPKKEVGRGKIKKEVGRGYFKKKFYNDTCFLLSYIIKYNQRLTTTMTYQQITKILTKSC